jgi:hypothetical protein
VQEVRYGVEVNAQCGVSETLRAEIGAALVAHANGNLCPEDG